MTEIFGAKKTKEQIAKEERESREMLAKHKEKMGQYYLEGDSANGEETTKSRARSKRFLVRSPPPCLPSRIDWRIITWDKGRDRPSRGERQRRGRRRARRRGRERASTTIRRTIPCGCTASSALSTRSNRSIAANSFRPSKRILNLIRTPRRRPFNALRATTRR